MEKMFYESRVFNQDLSTWDVQNVENMSYMFYGAENFNQDLSNWCTAQINSVMLRWWENASESYQIQVWLDENGLGEQVTMIYDSTGIEIVDGITGLYLLP